MQTNNVLILTTNNFDLLNSSNITVSPTPVSQLPKENLQKEDASSIMRILSTSATIDLVFNTVIPVNCIFLHDCNFTTNTVVNLKLYSDNNFTNLVRNENTTVSSTLLSSWRPCFAFDSFESLNIQSARISISGAESRIDIGRLFIGKALQPKVNFAYGWEFGLEDPSIQDEMSDGSLHVQELNDYRKVNFTLEALDEEENDMQEWFNGLKFCGIRRQVLISLFPKGDTTQFLNGTFIGKFTSSARFSQDYYRNFNASYEIRETIGGNIDPTLNTNNYEGCQESILSLESQILSLSIQNNELQDTIDSLNAEVASLESEINRLTDYKAEYEGRLEALEVCCAEVQQLVQDASDQLTAFNNKVNYIEANLT